MRETDILCATGLSLQVREFLVKDENLLADRKSIRKGTAITSLLEAITVRVDDIGPYEKYFQNGKLDWRKVLQGDRMVVLLKNRIQTWGPEFTYKIPCPNCPNNASIEIDLNELEIKELPERSRKHASDPTIPLQSTFEDGKTKFQFRLLRGEDDKAMTKLQNQNQDSLSSAYLRFRILGIEGVKPNELTSFIENLGSREASYLRSEFDEWDCGVNQEVEMECQHCGYEWIDDVRFNSDFLFPKYRKKRSSKT